MKRYGLSPSDEAFRRDFEAGGFAPADFDHRAHVRLAYTYLAESDTGAAIDRVRTALLAFLDRHGIPRAKYHETMTRAWVMAVRHFMEAGAGAPDADRFIEENPKLLDSKIMLEHYSADLLFSPEARARFVEPDRDDIPRHPD